MKAISQTSSKDADIVFYNGKVITIDNRNTITEAIAIKNNKVLAVGSDNTVKNYISDDTKIINLNGRSLLPGFIDAHVHLSIYGSLLLDINCQQSSINSLNDLFNELKEKTTITEKGKWIRAWSFSEDTVKDKRLPTKEELDMISKDHPIVITRICNHISVANSKALEIANINKRTNDPVGGIIEKDSSGELTGKLVETAHMMLSEKSSLTNKEMREALRLASDTFVKYGITSIHDAGGYGDGPSILKLMRQGINSGDIKVRIYSMIGSLTDAEKFIKQMKEKNIRTGDGSERFKVGPVKLFLDGSSTGPTIATREPYTNDQTNQGILYYNQEQINEILGDAHNRGYQITAHAQGDKAIEYMLNCIEKSLKNKPKRDHRHRIEHAGIVPQDLLRRMKLLNVIPIPNPSFIYVNGNKYVDYYGNRVNVMYPANDYIENNIRMAIGSDAPAVSCT